MGFKADKKRLEVNLEAVCQASPFDFGVLEVD